VLAEGLAESPPAWRRLAALVTDAREQLAELVPPNDNPAAQALRLQLHDKLETVGGGHRACLGPGSGDCRSPSRTCGRGGRPMPAAAQEPLSNNAP
jgi:hypothetical protein